MASEKLVYEIAALYSDQPEIKKVFDDFAKLNKQGAKVTEQLERLANMSKKTGEAVRSQRRGVAQLGMQMSQFTTQLQTGTSFSTAFAQQIGDVGYALSTMGGTLGRVGTAIAGFGGIVISLGVMALVDMFKATEDTTEATRTLTEVLADEKSSVKEVIEALKEYNNQQKKARTLTIDELADKARAISANYKLAEATYKVLEAKLKIALFTAQELAKTGEAPIGALNDIKNLAGAMELTQKRIEETGKASKNVVIEVAQEIAKLKTDPIYQLKTGFDQMREAAMDLDLGPKELAEELARITRLEDMAIEKMEEKQKKAKKVNEKLTEQEKIAKKIARELAKIEQKGNRAFQRLIDSFEGKPLEVGDFSAQLKYDAQRAMDQIRGMSEEAAKSIERSFENIGMSVSSAFKDMLTAGASWKDGMRGIIQAVIDELWRLFVVQQIVGFVKSALGGIFGAGASSGFDPGKSIAQANANLAGMATGGYPQPGKATLVGERGPELFIPSSSGKIVANHNLGGGGGGMVINVDARGSSDPAAVRAQVQQGILEAAPAIIAASQQKTFTALGRPKLGGVIR